MRGGEGLLCMAFLLWTSTFVFTSGASGDIEDDVSSERAISNSFCSNHACVKALFSFIIFDF